MPGLRRLSVLRACADVTAASLVRVGRPPPFAMKSARSACGVSPFHPRCCAVRRPECLD